MSHRTMLALTAAALLAGCGAHDPAAVTQAPPGFAFSDVSAGPTHACAVDLRGSVYCWGDGRLGQLGKLPGDVSFTPVKVNAAAVFRSVGAGFSHTCALALDGTAWCWGWGILGELGNGTLAQAGPVVVNGQHRFSMLSVGWDHACGIAEGGAAFCWGNNADGQLGDSSTVNRSSPVRVAGGLRFSSISAGTSHTCAIDLSGRAYCWGSNTLGQLGRGAGAGSTTAPAPVAGGLSFTEVSAGYTHSCGVSGERVYCWGSNTRGELGDLDVQRPGIAGSSVPVQVSSVAMASSQMATVSAGYQFTCAAGGQGGFCWGRGDQGQLGTGVLRDNPVPLAISASSGSLGPDVVQFARLSAGGLDYACGLSATNAVYCWGNGAHGQLGSAQTVSSLVPVRVAAP